MDILINYEDSLKNSSHKSRSQFCKVGEFTRQETTIYKTPGYCWPTPFKVLGVLFLGEVCSAFLPSKKACWAYQFRYLGVGQQYPPVLYTPGVRSPFPRQKCNKTWSKNQCTIEWSCGRFWIGEKYPGVGCPDVAWHQGEGGLCVCPGEAADGGERRYDGLKRCADGSS
jgi:hypothetical protein